MGKTKGKPVFLVFIFILFILVSGCSDPASSELSRTAAAETPIPVLIKDNVFSSNLLGIDMELPGDWYVYYQTTPDYIGAFSLISGFDSTASIDGAMPVLIFDHDVISFAVDTHDERNAGFQFIASRDEYDGISLGQVVKNAKDGFEGQSEILLEDLPDLNADGLTIRRFRYNLNEFVSAIHIFQVNGYSVIISCNYSNESVYVEMTNIIESIRRK